MSVARINIKNIDYFKYKKLVIDGNRDDYSQCSKEVQKLCDGVQTLNFRDDEFDDEADRGRFEEICTHYRQILQSKRIDPLDMRIKSGWWGDHKNAYSAGKIKPGVLKDILVSKAKDWSGQNNVSQKKIDNISNTIEGPGIYVLKHKEHQCFQYVGRAEKMFSKVAEKLKMSFEGSLVEPLAALLIISMASDWEFYFIAVAQNENEKLLRILENDRILRHDSIWPHGLNFRLHIDSLLEVSEFRKSCLRHHWPPAETEQVEEDIDLNVLKTRIANGHDVVVEEIVTPPPKPPRPNKNKKPSPTEEEQDQGVNHDFFDRPPSPSETAVTSSTYVVPQPKTDLSPSSGSSELTIKNLAEKNRKEKAKLAGGATVVMSPRPNSAKRKAKPPRSTTPRSRPPSSSDDMADEANLIRSVSQNSVNEPPSPSRGKRPNSASKSRGSRLPISPRK